MIDIFNILTQFKFCSLAVKRMLNNVCKNKYSYKYANVSTQSKIEIFAYERYSFLYKLFSI